MTLCICCDAPATHLMGDWEVCEAHAASLTTPDPLCAAGCGQPLTSEDIEAGETVCLDCARAEVLATLAALDSALIFDIIK